jgi:uncharacterized RDD family membrane protein YckC
MAPRDRSAIKRHYAFVLRVVRLISLVILGITSLIAALACVDIIGDFKWGASWTSLLVSALFIILALLIYHGASWALRHSDLV